MKPLTPQVRKNWADLCRLHTHLEQLCLEVLAHPGATIEQIMHVRAKLIKHRKELRDHYELLAAAPRNLLWQLEVPGFLKRKEKEKEKV